MERSSANPARKTPINVLLKKAPLAPVCLPIAPAAVGEVALSWLAPTGGRVSGLVVRFDTAPGKEDEPPVLALKSRTPGGDEVSKSIAVGRMAYVERDVSFDVDKGTKFWIEVERGSISAGLFAFVFRLDLMAIGEIEGQAR